MRMNKSFQDATIDIFTHIFSPEQIAEMIQIDLSEDENILNLPADKYIENKFKIADTINENGKETTDSDLNEIVLASYTLMDNSPGMITFYKDNIKLYIISLIDSLNCKAPIGLNTALYIHYFVMNDLLTHEGAHLYFDFKRQLTGAKFEIETEEKLAVAHSYNQFSIPFFRRILNIEFMYVYDKFLELSYNKQLFSKMRNEHRILYDFLMKEHFMSYQSADYTNWQLFTHKNAYKTHFYDYVKNAKLDRFLDFGIPVNKIAEEIALIGVVGAQIVVE